MNDRYKNNGHKDIDRLFLELLPERGFKVRDEQVKLCHEMFEALATQQTILCDAGVGIGKTYAYIAATAIFYEYNTSFMRLSPPIVISTASIALQNAIMQEYIPLLSEIMKKSHIICRRISAVIRKGKSHYVCDYRLQKRLIKANLVTKNERAKTALLSLRRVRDMDEVTHLSNFDKRQVCVPKSCDCKKTVCRYKEHISNCNDVGVMYQICNHNYLIADAIHKNTNRRSLIPEYSAMIIDEAHKLPEAARQMFSNRITAEDMLALIKELETADLRKQAQEIAKVLRPIMLELSNVQTDVGTAEYDLNAYREKYLQHAIAAIDALKLPIETALYSAFKQLQDTLVLLLEHRDNYIYCIERDDNAPPALMAISQKYVKQLQQNLFSTKVGTVLTSGTLAVGEDFSAFQSETGLSQSKSFVYKSPFDYEQNCLLYFPSILKYAPGRGKEYVAELSENIRVLIEISNGHTLVLFNSYSLMNEIFTLLKPLEQPLFVTKKNDSHIFDDFKASGNGVLLATGSVWEGMDFPGDIVSSLIICRLPFAVPDVVSERTRENSSDIREFIQQFAVPKMQIKLRQGVGRAIRTETDTCVISILDERALVGQRFHKAVIDVLPKMPVVQDIKEVDSFLKRVKDEMFFKI